MSRKLLNFLLVEDELDHAHLITRNLEKERISNEITHVDDGEKALKYLRKETPYEDAIRPDIILLDLKLPKVDGLQVLSEIKKDSELSAIPVVILTTSDAESDRLRAYEEHANSYVVKPVDFDKFKQMVRDLSLYWGVWNVPAPDSGK